MNVVLTIDWSIIPTHTIDVGNLRKPYDICTIMKDKGIEKYLYRITYKGIVLKYGISADNSKNHGDRLYRQISHASGWGVLQNQGSSGRDFRGVEEALLEEYGIVLDLKDLSIKLWDVTNHPFQTIDPFKEIEAMESELVDNHIAATGRKPLGNIEHKKFASKSPGIPAVLYNGLFQET